MAVIAAGYVAALAVAVLAVKLNDAGVDPATRQGGMSAFGDSLLFLGVFAVCAVPSTGYAFYLLRSRPLFWRVLLSLAFVIVGTELVAFVVELIGRNAEIGTAISSAAALAIIRILVAPMFALAFMVAGVFAPTRFARFAFFGATVVEGATFAIVFIGLLQ
jgi:hypothetical protein